MRYRRGDSWRARAARYPEAHQKSRVLRYWIALGGAGGQPGLQAQKLRLLPGAASNSPAPEKHRSSPTPGATLPNPRTVWAVRAREPEGYGKERRKRPIAHYKKCNTTTSQ